MNRLETPLGEMGKPALMRRGVEKAWGLQTLLLGLFVSTSALAQSAPPPFSTPGSWTFTVPPGVTQIGVEVLGAGGGGGGADSARGGDGANGSRVSATINVAANDVLSGTIGAGGVRGYTAGNPSFGFGSPCQGSGPGGSGVGAGGAGANVNCRPMPNPYGYSGGGGGGGGGTTMALNGTVFVQAGGGGGGGGGLNGPIGGNGSTSLSLTASGSCGANGTGQSADPLPTTISNGDGGGGGGGGGGFTGGAAGASQPDHLSSSGGSGGTSCYATSPKIVGTPTIASTGGAGGAGRSGETISTATAGSGSVVISYLIAMSVQKSVNALSDPVNNTVNPKLIPGGTARYCLVIVNFGSKTLESITINDIINDKLTYVPGQVKSGTTCNTASSTFSGSVTQTGNTLSFSVGNIPGNSSYALTFTANVN